MATVLCVVATGELQREELGILVATMVVVVVTGEVQTEEIGLLVATVFLVVATGELQTEIGFLVETVSLVVAWMSLLVHIEALLVVGVMAGGRPCRQGGGNRTDGGRGRGRRSGARRPMSRKAVSRIALLSCCRGCQGPKMVVVRPHLLTRHLHPMLQLVQTTSPSHIPQPRRALHQSAQLSSHP